MIKKADIIIAASVIVAALIILGAFFLFSPAGGYAVVKRDGKTVKKIPLGKDSSVVVADEEQGYNTVVVKGGKVWVESADCPEQVCVSHRPIEKQGEIIVCIPHKLTVEIAK